MMEEAFIVVVLILALIFFGGRAAGISGVARRQVWPYYAKKPLTKPEQVLYHRLVKSLPECIVLAQVQVSRVLGVKKGFRFHEWNNRINRLSLDYVICHKDSTVIAGIELDDASHEKEDRQEADRRKDKAMASAGISLIRWSVKNLPSEAEIRAVFIENADPTVVERSSHQP